MNKATQNKDKKEYKTKQNKKGHMKSGVKSLS